MLLSAARAPAGCAAPGVKGGRAGRFVRGARAPQLTCKPSNKRLDHTACGERALEGLAGPRGRGAAARGTVRAPAGLNRAPRQPSTAWTADQLLLAACSTCLARPCQRGLRQGFWMATSPADSPELCRAIPQNERPPCSRM